jgi:F5/8 type C domain
MGISIYLAEAIIQEHLYKKLPDEVYTIGKPFLGFSYEDLLAICKRNGVDPRNVVVEQDTETTEGKLHFSKTGEYAISVSTFFSVLGVTSVKTIDISPYEGADLIVNLCFPIDERLEGTVEFIVGGSTLDNVFDPAQYLKNMSRLLRPGGRIVEINHTTDHNRPYIILPPAWYYDYFVVNKFSDCMLYVLEHSDPICFYQLVVNYNAVQSVGWGLIENFEDRTNNLAVVLVIAEKGNDSTWDIVPTQDAYRSEEEVKRYNSNLLAILDSTRPCLKLWHTDFRPERYRERIPPNNYKYIGHYESNLLKPFDERPPISARGTASASTTYGNCLPQHALREGGWSGQFWHSHGGMPQWWQIEFEAPRVIGRIDLAVPTFHGAMGKKITVHGSMDKRSWQQIAELLHSDSDAIQIHNFSNDCAYRYYRLEFISTWRSDEYAGISYARFFESR